MEIEVVVEWFVLQIDVTHCENIPPQPSNRESDWDCQGSRELEFKVLSGITYDNDGVRMDVTNEELAAFAKAYAGPIETALWFEIDSQRQRERRWAA